MKILITGGAGFIGSNLAHQLITLGGDVLVVDNLSSGCADNLNPGAEFRKLDISDESFTELVCEYQPEVIVHLADNTLANVEKLIATIRELRPERFIFCSSTDVYAEIPCESGSHEPLSEQAPLIDDRANAHSYLEVEAAIRDALTPDGIDYALLRLPHVYGPRQSSGLINEICQTLSCNDEIFLELPEDQQEDFIFISDLVSALVSCIGGEIDFADVADGDLAGVYNIASGEAMSMGYVTSSLLRMSRRFIPLEFEQDNDSYPLWRIFSYAKAQRVFEWAPQVPLEVGLQKTWSWHELNGQEGKVDDVSRGV
jgi:UDP-glucose 4-epimerase